MVLTHYVNYFIILLVLKKNYIWSFQCYQCNTKAYNHHVTINDLPSPTEDDCNVLSTNHSCYVRVDWLGDGTSEVYYRIDPATPYDSIIATTERELILKTGEYLTRRSIGYSCISTTRACNTIDDLKRAIVSITFPADKYIHQLDTLIIPTKIFNSSLCLHTSTIQNCPELDLIKCRRCTSTVLYDKRIDICATCPAKRPIRNHFTYETAFLLNTDSRIERIRIGCQIPYACNSLENAEEIKRLLTPKLDLEKFYKSTASIIELATQFLIILILIHTIWFIEHYY